MKNPKTYCVITTSNNIPYLTVENQQNILCNAKNISPEVRKSYANRGYVFDDTGDNISNLNYTFAELTGLYWVWKNTCDPISGITHYRRFWNQQHIKDLQFNENTLYTLSKINLNQSLHNHFLDYHGPYGMNLLEDVILNNNFRFTKHHLELLKTIDFLHCCNMFFCSRPILERVCEILFEVLFEMYRRGFLDICQFDNHQRRLLGFVSERLFTIICSNLNDFFDQEVKLQEANIIMIQAKT